MRLDRPWSKDTYIEWPRLVNFINAGGVDQGWEFIHRFSEKIARFLFKNEQMSDSIKKLSDSLIRSFLVRDLSDSLTIAHFL